nr:anaerobic ribonucleoside-triphosphate reductase [Anaerotardibacter muris]
MNTLEAPAFAAQNTLTDAKANLNEAQANAHAHTHKPAASTEHKHLQNVSITVSYSTPDDLRVTDEELAQYIARGRQLEPSKDLAWIDCAVEAEDVAIHYGYHAQPFERIRRITGYLVGTLDRFNDAKRAEESQRVKHDVPCTCR